jgi:glycosyltransferase involved in cell wall biosynthesis
MQESRVKSQENYDVSLGFVKSPLAVNPLVSIIVPVFNAEEYLKDCLDSLIAQTLNEIEIICVNDGSTDRSLEILTEYSNKDPRIHVFSQTNAGPGMARNTALDNTNGKYILFCDSDDTMEPDAARECSLIMENNLADFAVFNTKIIDVNRTEDAKKNSLGEYITLVNPMNSGILSKIECIKISRFGTVWGYVFRRDVINRYKLRFTKYNACEDSIFLLTYLLTINSGYAVNRFFYNYYARQGSLFEAVTKHNPWLKRFMFLPRLLYNTFVFALRNGMPLRGIYIFYWLFSWLRGKK